MVTKPANSIPTRYYARSRQQSQVPEKLRAVSNFSPKRENLSVPEIASSFRLVRNRSIDVKVGIHLDASICLL